ncbi:MAG: PQQ-binding-like beta-propeller repeat protein [Clostridia bacterium]|nr:PQQ-binding-like beta-propeller repeat protein [Clostridia bacterium]
MSTSNTKGRKTNARKAPPAAGIQRGRRRLNRKHSQARRAINVVAASACILAVIGGGALLAISSLSPKPVPAGPEVEIAAPALGTLEVGQGSGSDVMTAIVEAPTATATLAPTDIPATEVPATEVPATPASTATLEPAPDPEQKPDDSLASSVYHQMAAPGAEYADPAVNNLVSTTEVFAEEGASSVFTTAEGQIHMGSSAQYATLEGVTTFRGSNYRDGGGYGVIPDNPSHLLVAWKKRIHGLDEWSGVGWTGQASVVRWPADLRAQMNINRAKKAKEGLTEVIYATLDGHIYFLDLTDGEETRKAINIGAPIKGSLAVDPRGVPLLYCGQGIYDVGGKRVACGTRIWSLIDQKQLYFINGKDSHAYRKWQAFDCSPLVDGDSDTMITAGENGVLYKVKLNTQQYTGAVTVDPRVTRYVYQQTAGGKVGTENSIAVYNNYVYFATNIGIIQCVDLNDMHLVWSFDAKDDIDASLVIEPESDGVVALYANNELDKRGHNGTCQMFKLNALTGELLWKRDSDPIRQNDDNGGGGFATPAVGKRDLSGLVFFHICRTKDTHGMLYALDKQTGETVWSKSLGTYGWSSPTCLYTASGKGYVLVGSSSGKLRLLDGLTGSIAAEVELKGNIEGTPAVFDDMIVVGTRSSIIYGIRIC